ncbi:MAG: carbohydrate-binding domain-containing protein [Ignavibacteriae bacterium]|nr:carbohydrate-binding domain-containing protein [Ignavibacteriota bacterium]
MRTTTLLFIASLALTLGVQAQNLTIVRPGGQSSQYTLTEIDSITFGVRDANAGSGLNTILRVHTKSTINQFSVSAIDSIGYDDANTMTVYLHTGAKNTFAVADVDSMSFAPGSAHTVTVAYNGASVTVDNPLAALGVTVTVSGADVTVHAAAGLDDITYVLGGTSTDGMFKIYSENPFGLQLNGLTLTNADGPAINVQAHKIVTVVLGDGTTNTLTDGATYATAPNSEDQKAAVFSEGQLTFTGTGSLTIVGKGTSQHGLCSDDHIEVLDGHIVVQSAVKDGIHTNDGYVQSGGSVEVTATSDGVDAGDGPVNVTGGTLISHVANDGRDALKTTVHMQISGGEVLLTVGGKGSKGLKASVIGLTGGKVTIQSTGGVTLAALGSGYDPSYCTAVKADSLVVLEGSQVSITTTGSAGRGFSCDGGIQILSGSLAVTSSGGGGTYTNSLGVLDAYQGPCLNADGNIVLSGGTITLTHSGSAGKGISGDGRLTIGTGGSSPALQITTTGTNVLISAGDYAEAKAISMDSLITINSGTITISSADDAVKSKVWIEVNGGTITIPKSVEGFEAPNLFFKGGEINLTSSDDGLNATYGSDIEGNDGSQLTISGGYLALYAPTGDGIDGNGNMTISGGTVIVHGPPSQPEVAVDVNGTFLISGGVVAMSQINSNMIELPNAASGQRSVLLKTSPVISAGTLIHIEDASGNTVVTFKPARNYSSLLFSSPALAAGASYKIYTQGSCTGTLKDGIYTGGTYSGGTLKTTFTSTSVAQTVTF